MSSNILSSYILMHCSEEEYQAQLIKDREQDIIQTSKDINTVNVIFKDLNALVVEQQGAVDDIENQVNQSVENTSNGLNELTKAKQNQKARNTCYMYTFGFSLFLIFILFLIIKLH